MSGEAHAGLSLRIQSTLAEIDAVAPEWRALEERCDCPFTFFQTFGWCRNWLSTVASRGGSTPEVRTVWRGDRLVAVWPLMRTALPFGVSKLETLGAPHAQYTNAVCDPDEDEAVLATILSDSLGGQGGIDLAELNAVPGRSALGDALPASAARPFEHDATAILDLSGFASADAYRQSLGKAQRRNRKRRLVALEQIGPVEFSVLFADHPDYPEVLATAMAFKRRWLKETGRYSTGFSVERYEEFLASLPGEGASRGGACLSVLRCNGAPVAIELGFVHKRHYYSYIGSFDWDMRDASPGKIQMDQTVGWLIENGIDAFDFLGNAAEYTRAWANSAVSLKAFAITLTPAGALYAGAWLKGARPAMKRLMAAIPATVRRYLPLGQSVSLVVLGV